MNLRTETNCPYCYTVNVEWFTGERRKLVTCDWERGGCDKQYIVDVVVITETTVRKIEGEETRK